MHFQTVQSMLAWAEHLGAGAGGGGPSRRTESTCPWEAGGARGDVHEEASFADLSPTGSWK